MTQNLQDHFLQLKAAVETTFKEYADLKMKFELSPHSDTVLKSRVERKKIDWLNALSEFESYTPLAT